MAERLFSASKYAGALFGAAGAKKMRVATFGESHGQGTYMGAALQDMCWRVFPADIRYDTRQHFTGTGDAATTVSATPGDSYAIGGSTTASLVNTQVPKAVADQATDPKDIAIIQSGYNDQPTHAVAITAANRVIEAANALLAAGYKYVIIGGIQPRGTSSSFPGVGWTAFNYILRKYVASKPGTFFLDTSLALADMSAASTGVPAKANVLGDGTHTSYYGQRLIANLLGEIFSQICARRTPRRVYNPGAYDPAAAPYGDMLGDTGGMLGTAGVLNGVVNTGVPGINASNRIAITAPTASGFNVTPSIVTGDDGEKKLRLDLSGSTPASGSSHIQVAFNQVYGSVANGEDADRKMDLEGVVNLSGVSGLIETQLRYGNSGTGYYTVAAGNYSTTPRPEGATEDLFMYTLFPTPVPGVTNTSQSIMFFFATGVAPAGVIEISRLSMMVVEE